jgi:murein L,D-transpeptidase YcbB/YkuD
LRGDAVRRHPRLHIGTRISEVLFATCDAGRLHRYHPASEEIVSNPLNIAIAVTGRARRTTAGVVAGALVGMVAAAGVCAEPGGGVAAAMPPAFATPADVPAGRGGPSALGDSDLKTRIEGTGSPYAAGEKLHGTLLRQFYAQYNFQPVWGARPAPAKALLALVLRAEEHGLDPGLFHAAALRNPSTLSPIDYELLLSDAFLAYADALARGAVPIETRLDDEDLTPEPIDIPATLATAIAGPDPAAVIAALAPASPTYQALRRALQQYRAGAGDNTGNRETGGARDDGRAALRHPGRGLAGRSADTRLHQIIANLERQRWLPRNLPADRVWVNIANAQLVFYRGDRPVFTTRVIVGQNTWQTPELRTSIDSLLFNPPWNVPPSIASLEILPKLGQDPDYLARHHMVRRSNGAIQQLPGAGTALGQIKFEMPNRFDVYLHDTPQKTLFSRDNRRQSHGCVRVQNPRELGALLLGEPIEAINRGIATGYTNRRMLPAPVPVFLVYQTAYLDEGGALEFHPDVYQRDDEIWQRLHPARQAPVAQREPLSQPRG